MGGTLPGVGARGKAEALAAAPAPARPRAAAPLVRLRPRRPYSGSADSAASRSGAMRCMTALMSARCVNACGKFP